MQRKPALLLLFASAACGTTPEHDNFEEVRSLTAALTAPCSAAWSAQTAYTGGNTASVNGQNYQANWWTQGQDPVSNSGAAGSGKVWTSKGACSNATTATGSSNSGTAPAPSTTPAAAIDTCAKAWAASAVYTAGNTASSNGKNYKANWWTQGQDPASNSGAPGSGVVWTTVGPCSGNSASTPAAPSPAAPAKPTTKPGAPVDNSGHLFGPYKDVTISANWNTSVISTKVNGNLVSLLEAAPEVPSVTWAFATGECGQENWGGIPGAQLASANIPDWVSAQKRYILSTGGAAGAFSCGSDAGFSAFIDRYASDYLVGIDFDIEAGQNQATIDALIQRVKVAQTNPKYSKLRFSFTLATLGGNSPQSLGHMGTVVMESIKKAGLQNYIINLMAMDYGSAIPGNCTLASNNLCDMGASASQAAINLHSFYNVPYSQIELTPMIGGNDVQDETFTLNDVTTVVDFAKKNGLAGLHYWSFDRDTDCAPGYASPICNSYGKSGVLGFAKAFAKQY
jgi:chitinase